MPYVKSYTRELLANDAYPEIESPGTLNYLITRTCQDYLDQHTLNYQTINDILGALEGAKLEFYRRIAVPYENAKIKENGDVYHYGD